MCRMLVPQEQNLAVCSSDWSLSWSCDLVTERTSSDDTVDFCQRQKKKKCGFVLFHSIKRQLMGVSLLAKSLHNSEFENSLFHRSPLTLSNRFFAVSHLLYSSLHRSHHAPDQFYHEQLHPIMAAARAAQRHHPRLRAALLREGKTRNIYTGVFRIIGFIPLPPNGM